jgi:hypothetical protein
MQSRMRRAIAGSSIAATRRSAPLRSGGNGARRGRRRAAGARPSGGREDASPVEVERPPNIAGASSSRLPPTWSGCSRRSWRRSSDHRVFERDGWRCTVPGCSSCRNLHSHPIVFRSHHGPGERILL